MWFSALFHEDFYPDLGTESSLHTAVILGLSLKTRFLQSPVDQAENYAEYNPRKIQIIFGSFKSIQNAIVVEIYFEIAKGTVFIKDLYMHRIQELIFRFELL